jgi:tRNA/tmRNA/rRNA uracil-C5-methylase (TrmA/RlmC/RlmD family)
VRPSGDVPVELTLGAPAAGGGMVAHLPDGRVAFVRHGLPGERVAAVVTEPHASWVRADAVDVLAASPDRVEAPCPYARPGACGGCDYQHARPTAQRALKAELVTAQLHGVGHLDVDVEVTPLLPARRGLGTRTRVRFGVGEDGRLALRRHHSHELVAVDRCALAVAAIDALALGARPFPPGVDVEVVALAGSPRPTVSITRATGGARRRTVTLDGDGLAATQTTVVDGLAFHVSPGVFWQVHEAAPAVLTEAVLDGLGLVGADRVVDLYCGAGLFTAAIARVVGPDGSVVGLDHSAAAVADARRNLAPWRWASARPVRVDGVAVRAATATATRVVLDPPRRGAPRPALDAVAAARSVRRVVYVSCEPSTLARDLVVLGHGGFALEKLSVLDCFEMTEHVECVAVLSR